MGQLRFRTIGDQGTQRADFYETTVMAVSSSLGRRSRCSSNEQGCSRLRNAHARFLDCGLCGYDDPRIAPTRKIADRSHRCRCSTLSDSKEPKVTKSWQSKLGHRNR